MTYGMRIYGAVTENLPAFHQFFRASAAARVAAGLSSVADLLAWHEAGQEEGRRPPDRDRVQADNQAEAFDLAGDPITLGRI